MQLTRCDDEQVSESPANLHKDMLKLKRNYRHVVETFVDCACLTIQNFIV